MLQAEFNVRLRSLGEGWSWTAVYFTQDYSITWTISPFSEHGGMPSTVSFPWEGDTVYFSESIRAQFLPNGSGFGRLDSNISLPLVAVANSTEEMQRAAATTVDSGALIRFVEYTVGLDCFTIGQQVPKMGHSYPLSQSYRPVQYVRSLSYTLT